MIVKNIKTNKYSIVFNDKQNYYDNVVRTKYGIPLCSTSDSFVERIREKLKNIKV